MLITIGLFEQFIMAGCCFRIRTTTLSFCDGCERSITPGDLRRAIDYMEANLAAPITIADIAEASGIAGRTLFQYFRDFRGTSPMRYLRDARFEKVRDALKRAQSEEGVAETRNEVGVLPSGPLCSRISEALWGEPFGNSLEAPGRTVIDRWH